MHVTIDEFREYAEANAESRTYETRRGTEFSFELRDSPKPAVGFPYTIRFKSPGWSESTVRVCSASAAVRFPEELNADNNKPASEYRNLGEEETSSARARYLLFLFRDLAEQKRQAET